MKLTEETLSQHGALYIELADGTLLGVEECESYGDIESRLYENVGTKDDPEWEVKPNVTYGGPWDTLAELLAERKTFGQWNGWKSAGEVKFH